MTQKFKSKNEQVVHTALQELYPNTKIEYEYSLGRGLHLDFLIHSTLKIGIEVDGEQHYSFNSYFHETLEDFKGQQARDCIKNELCSDLGINLIRVDGRKSLDVSEALKVIIEELEEVELITTGELKEMEKKRKRARRQRNAEQYRYVKSWRLKK